MVLAVKVSLFVIILSVFLVAWRWDSRWRLVFTPFLLVMYFAFLRFLPPFFVADDLGVAHSLKPLIVAVVAIGCVMAGYAGGYYRRPNGPRTALRLSSEYTGPLLFRREQHIAVLVVACLLVGLGIWFYRGVPAPLESLISLLSGQLSSESALVVSDQRFALTKGAYFGGEYRAQGLFSKLFWVGWALVCAYAALYCVERRTLHSVGWFICAIVAAWVFVAGDGTRGPFLGTLIVVVATCSYRRALSVRSIAIIGTSILVLAVLMSLYSTKMNSLIYRADDLALVQQATERIMERVLLGNAINDVRVVEFVDAGIFDVRLGTNHLRDIASALPGVQYGVPLAHEVFMVTNPGSTGTTFSSGSYLSDVYVDFSWYGVVPLFFLAGLVVGWGQRIMFALPPTPWNVAFAGLMGYVLARVFWSGFQPFLATMVVVLTVLAVFVVVSKALKTLSVRTGAAPHGRWA